MKQEFDYLQYINNKYSYSSLFRIPQQIEPNPNITDKLYPLSTYLSHKLIGKFIFAANNKITNSS